MTIADALTIVISAGSLVVAIIALVKSSRAVREANAAQGRIVEIEEEREKDRRIQTRSARLRAELQRSGSSHRLVVFNDGESEARNVHIFVNEQPLHEHKFILVDEAQRPVIGPKSSVFYVVALSRESPRPPYRISIEWEDDSGGPGRYRTSLS